jgi:dephospho-CoA kinase
MIICITGCYGSGKTTAARYLGLKIVSADRIGRDAFDEKKKEIKKLFGTADRKKIREKIFSDRKSLKKFNTIVHPLLIKKLKNEINKNKARNIAIDAALYYDLGLESICDRTILIKRNKEKIIKTLKKPRHETEKIIRNQRIPKKADFVIINNRSKEELKRKVAKIINILSSKRFLNN